MIKNESQNKKRILIVEDEAIIALNLKMDLESLGYEVIDTVGTADDAIDVAVEHRTDLTIMDINLRGKADGIEAAQKISALDLATIYLTANADDVTFNKALELSPASSFIEKPYSISSLSKNIELAIIDKLLNLKKLMKQEELLKMQLMRMKIKLNFKIILKIKNIIVKIIFNMMNYKKKLKLNTNYLVK